MTSPSRKLLHTAEASLIIFTKEMGLGKGQNLFCRPSKVVFHQKSSSIKGIAELGLCVVRFICRDSPNVVNFKCSDCPYVVHFRRRDCTYVESLRAGPPQLPPIVPSTWSTSMTSIICLFDLGHPNDLNGEVA